jgi:hypothetical protein
MDWCQPPPGDFPPGGFFWPLDVVIISWRGQAPPLHFIWSLANIISIHPAHVLFARNLQRLRFLALWCYKRRLSANSRYQIKTYTYIITYYSCSTNKQ